MRSIAKRSLISVAVFFLLYVGACFLWNSPSSPYQYGHYIPADLNDAHAQLMGLFPAKELDAIRASTSEDFMVNYHLGLGMGIRNTWALWGGSRLSRYFNRMGVYHPDDMSGIILTTFWRKLHNRPMGLEELVAGYREEGKTETLIWHLKKIPMGGFEMKDASVATVIETFEKRFQDYRKNNPDAAAELTKTLFKIEASKPLLLYKVTFKIADDGNLLWGLDLLSKASTGLVTINRDPAFQVEGGQLVIRDGALTDEDIKDLSSLVAKLKAGKDGVSQFLLDELGDEARKGLAQYKAGSADSVHLTEELVLDFNRMTSRFCIYEAGIFTNVVLSAETRALLGTKPRGQALIRLNRMLLEDAYPQEIAKRRTKE